MKKSPNPKIIELTKSHRERSFCLGNLDAIVLDGTRYCLWCTTTPMKHWAQKYCSAACSNTAMAWAYPQREESLGLLLIKQSFKCAACAFDYTSIVEGWRSSKAPYGVADILKKDYRNIYNYWLVKQLKRWCTKNHPAVRLEVDHIVPIYKGGQPLERENLQALCFTCHKAKSKVDNSGKRTTKRKPRAPRNKIDQLRLEVERLKIENQRLNNTVTYLIDEDGNWELE